MYLKMASFNLKAFYELEELNNKGYKMSVVTEKGLVGDDETQITLIMKSPDGQNKVMLGGTIEKVKM